MTASVLTPEVPYRGWGGACRSWRPVGIAHTSPSYHGKLSQHGVAEDRRIAFAVARKLDDAFRDNFPCFLLVVGQVELAANFIKSS